MSWNCTFPTKETIITIRFPLFRTNICRGNAQVEATIAQWDKAPAEVQASYGEVFFNAYLKAVRSTVAHARSNVDEVIDVLIHAVSCQQPDYDYTPHWSTKLRSATLHMLPLPIEDWLMKRMKAPIFCLEDFMDE